MLTRLLRPLMLLRNPATWPLVGGVCILLVSMAIHAALSHNRTAEVMHTLLTEKGSALLSSLESGLRSSRRGNAALRTEFLLEELASREDVQFIAITAPDGLIMAHSDPTRLGEVLMLDGAEISATNMERLRPTLTSQWHILDVEGEQSFVIYKLLAPTVLGLPAHHRMRRLGPVGMLMFVGLDPAPLFQARAEDQRRTLMVALGGVLCGLLALVALHWAGRAQASRQGQRAAEALTEKMVLSLPDGLMLLNAQGRISHINDVACRWLQLPVPPLGQLASDVLPPALAVLITPLLSGSSLQDTELELPFDGGQLPLNVRGGQVETPGTGRVGSLVLMRDLSERRRLEAEIRRREKLAAVGNLAAGVAHEIRNPLSSIKGYATYFGERFPEGSEDREAARVMVGEVDRLNRVITDLIGLARPADVDCRPTDMRELVADTLRLIKVDADAHHVSVTLQAPDDLPLARIDPDRMRQVVLNICLNALESMPDGGELTLHLAADAEHLHIEVRDTGSGIAPEVLASIFDPYFTTKGHGTGLGLPTVHKIVEAHGGNIVVNSSPGQGASFQLCLPL